jgi:transcriptional regulator with AAA-type ATPase domain/tetratricopeptide (TPR) repeat protein
MRDGVADLIGDSPGVVAVREQVGRLLARQGEARRLPPVLIQGETGTGKGLVARILHGGGPRAGGPFVDVNCAAIPETLLEAEMFGFERGAFTDARQAKAGLFQAAHGGTIFLDEVGLLPEALQAKLLKVIEERAVRRLGSTRSEGVDVWVVAATSEPLPGGTQGRRFREDLYHRLAVVTLTLPPLRERGSDILRLAEHFLAAACADYGLPPKTLSPAARAALLAYPWSGNIRELANVMERVALLSDAFTVTPKMLALPDAASSQRAEPPRGETLRSEPLREHLLAALRGTNWNVSHAAARLGMSRNTLRYRMEKYRLGPPPAEEPVAPAAPAPLLPEPVPAGPGLTGGGRPVTLLRAALVLPSGSGPADVARLLETLVEKVQTFGGRLEDIGALGLEAAFGADPLEDAPLRAAHAALAMQKAAERAIRPDGQDVALKIGLHAGHFRIESLGGVAAIDREARSRAATALAELIERAEPGMIVATEAAVQLLERRFDLEPLPRQTAAASAAYRVIRRDRPAPGLTRRMATFVGRRHELELLHGRLASAVLGHGQVVGIAGEAGIGKTRLLFEFRESIAGRPVTYLEGHCLAYGSAIPYLPLLDLLRNSCGIGDIDTPEAIAEKVRGGLRAVSMDADEGAPYLLQLLGVKEGTARLVTLSPEAVKGRTFETLRQMALKGSRQRPLILALENLHWIDRTSEEYLASLVESLAGAPILVLLTYRPGYRPSWIEKSYATQVALQPLAPADSLSVVRSFLQTSRLPESVAEIILAKAEGNPFFLEELALSLMEHGDDIRAPRVPDTIQEVLMARIDRLPDEPKRVLQTASVLGREFSLRLLGAIWPGPGGLDPHLVELKRLEFLFEQTTAEEPAYVFKHTLTQDVAYQSVPPARRQTLHAAAGQALEAFYADRLEEAYDRLAHHYARTPEAGKAIGYLTRSAERAARTYAHAEAVKLLEEAVKHVERIPPAEQDRVLLDLRLREAHSLYFLGRFPEALALLERQREPLERLGEPRLAGPYYFWLGYTESHLGDHEQAAEHAARAIAEATRGGDQATVGKAYYVLARGGFWSGRFRQGVEDGRRAVAILEGTGEPWWLGAAHWGVAFNHSFLGEFAAALDAAARARAVGEAIGDPRLQAYAAWTTGWIHAAKGEWDAGIEACRRSLASSPDPVNTADAMSFLGYAYLGKGQAHEAIELLERSIQQWRVFRHRPMLGWFTTVLGEAYLLDGRLDPARDCASEGLAVSSAAGFRYGVGMAQRALGRIAGATGDLPSAERHLDEALRTFAAIQARHEEARTALELAIVVHARGDRAGAARHLAEAAVGFRALDVPQYEARTAALARELGLALG